MAGTIACGASSVSLHRRMLKRVLLFFVAGLWWETAAKVESHSQLSTEPSVKLVSTPSRDPIEHCEVAFETGVLWKVGGGATPLAYTILPQMLTIKIPPAIRVTFASGEFIVRSRFSLLAEPIIKGPETHFFGATAAASAEWWNHRRTTTLFFTGGGGMGGMNSKGHEIRGGQGQDLNFTWLMYLGARKSWNWSRFRKFMREPGKG